MKIPVSKLKLITAISILVILGIAGSFLTYGILFPSKDLPSGNSASGGDRLPQYQKLIDTHFEVQEWNISIVHNMTLVHLTFDDVTEFPDFEKSMHGVNNDPIAWRYGHRVVTWFDGNESDYIRFHNALCKNKTRAECYPNPPIFEYHGQYYTISSDIIGSHTTWSRTPQPTTAS